MQNTEQDLWCLEVEENNEPSVSMEYKGHRQGKQYTMKFKFQELH